MLPACAACVCCPRALLALRLSQVLPAHKASDKREALRVCEMCMAREQIRAYWKAGMVGNLCGEPVKVYLRLCLSLYLCR